jgi:hypothetical protein
MHVLLKLTGKFLFALYNTKYHMDFLDPQKQRAHTIRILVGYVLIGIALILTTIILLYHAYGFGVDRNGNVVQNGLVFVSSTPNPADIYIDGKQYKEDTNARMLLNSGQYTVDVKREGYRDWRRAITVEGGSVERFDYPFLFPTKLQTSAVKSYAKQPQMATASLDRKWLLTHVPDTADTFEVFDLSKPDEVAKTAKQVVVPSSAFTATQAGAPQSWELVQWSTDNKHVVLKHLFQKDGKMTHEFVLLNRDQPSESINLTNTWGVNPNNIELRDQKHDQYYLYDHAAATVTTASLEEPTPKPYLTNVLSFKSYADDTMLYATTQDEKTVAIKLRQGDNTQTIRTFAAGSQYQVNLTKYDGAWYVAAGSTADGRVFIYKNPVQQLRDEKVAVPVRILKVPGVNYVAFSANTRFVMAENGSKFAVYDAENDKGYTYDSKTSLDAPQTHATWMDGHRIIMTSAGKTVLFDFDGSNKQTLLPTSAKFLPFFDRDYEYLYTLSGAEATALQKTPLRTADDL